MACLPYQRDAESQPTGTPLPSQNDNNLSPMTLEHCQRDGPPLEFAVVIPARDAESKLSASLPALRSQLDGHTAEVIVVDDGSRDSTGIVAAQFGARVVTLPGLGPAAARNSGAAATCAPLLIFFDADCVPEPGCVEALLAAFGEDRVTGARGGYVTYQESLVARFVQLELEEKQSRMARSRRADLIDTACAAFRRDRFLAYGGFDESFKEPSVEDVDLTFRMAAGGELLVYEPGARVAHRHPSRLLEYAARKFRFGFNRARVYRQHPQKLGGDGYTPRLMPLQIILAPLTLVAAAAALPVSTMRQFAVSTCIAFLGTTLPLVIRAVRHDRAIAWLVPAMLAVRSLAQASGLAVGFVSLIVESAFRSRGNRLGTDVG